MRWGRLDEVGRRLGPYLEDEVDGRARGEARVFEPGLVEQLGEPRRADLVAESELSLPGSNSSVSSSMTARSSGFEPASRPKWVE